MKFEYELLIGYRTGSVLNFLIFDDIVYLYKIMSLFLGNILK